MAFRTPAPLPSRLTAGTLTFLSLAASLAPAQAQDKSLSLGDKSILVMRFDLSEAPGDPVQTHILKQTFEDVNTFFKANSRGKFSLDPTIAATLRLPRSRAIYLRDNGASLREDAYDTVRRGALHPERYDLEIIATPRMTDPFGQGTFGKRGLMLQGAFSWITIAQEVSVNLGMAASDLWRSKSTNPIGAGSAEAFKDPFDFLGAQQGNPTNSVINALHKWRAGWLSDTEVPLADKSGRFRIVPQDTAAATDTSSTKGVRVPMKNGGFYVVEFRPSIDSPRAKDGVLVYRTGDKPGRSQLLIMTPELEQTEGVMAAPLLTGRTFEDKANQVFVTPLKANGASNMEVAVNVGPFAGNHDPVVEIGANKWETEVDQPLTMAGLGKDEDGDEVAYWWEFGDGEMAGNQQKVTHTWKMPGVYKVKCHATDMKGGTAVYEGEFTVTGTAPEAEQPNPEMEQPMAEQ